MPAKSRPTSPDALYWRMEELADQWKEIGAMWIGYLEHGEPDDQRRARIVTAINGITARLGDLLATSEDVRNEAHSEA